MRGLALAAVVGVGLTLGGVAVARTWNDPAGRLVFDAPSGWVMEVMRDNPQTIVLAGDANNECYLIATPNSVSAHSSPDAVRHTVDQISAQAWVDAANSVAPMFPRDSAQLVSQTVETSAFWPLQRARFGGAERPVIAALTSRPGIDLMAFCWTYGGADATARYEAVFRSMSHPQDAVWRASAEAQVTERAAAEAVAAEPEPEPEAPPPDPRNRSRHR